MAGLITGTWTLLSSSAQLVAGAQRMTLKVHRLMQPGLLELSEHDRRQLVALQKRVDCLIHPLNYLLLWSKHRDSFVQQVVLSAQDLLSDVCDFVDKYFPQETGAAICAGAKSKASSTAAANIDSEQLGHYLRELEFACTSVTMAMSIAQRSDPLVVAVEGAPGEGSIGAAPVSLSALLRASRRIQDMHGRSGDLCACPGRLYCLEAASAAAAAGSRGLGRPPDSAGPSGVEAGRPSSWVPVLSLAAFKVFAFADGRPRKYGIAIESTLPLSQRGGQDGAEECGVQGGYACGFDDGSPSGAGGGLNNSGPQSFPVCVALDAQLLTTGALALPAEPSRCDLGGLGVDELALVWPGGDPAGLMPLACEDIGGGLVDAVLLPETACSAEVVQRPLWDRANRAPDPGGVATGGQQVAGADGGLCPQVASCFYAFVFGGRGGAAEPCGENDMPFTALDALYLARLCAHDDALAGQQGGRIPSPAPDGIVAREPGSDGGPPHLSSSDEVLAALLQQRASQCLPAAMTHGLPQRSTV